MDNLSKPDSIICKYRSTEILEPAKCSLFAELCGIKSEETPLFPINVCEYCLKQETTHKKSLLDDPFRSIYHKLVINNNLEPARRASDHLCHMRGQVKDLKTLELSDYQKYVFDCRKYGSCTIAPTNLNLRTCQTCTHGFNTLHLFKTKPDYMRIFHSGNNIIRYGRKVENWAVGIITAPRIQSTIKRCYNSLIANGFDNILVFSEPGQELDKNWDCIYRQTTLGIFNNFILALFELYLRNINADAYLITQDDMIYAMGCKDYLENFLWPEEKPHLICPYSPSMGRKTKYGWFANNASMVLTPTAFILSPASMRAFINGFGAIVNYCIKENGDYSDLGIYNWAWDNNYQIHCPWPSLTEHIGIYSTHDPTLHEHLLWAWQVIAPQALNNVEHWYVIDGSEYSIEQIKNVQLNEKFLVISKQLINGIITTIDPIRYIKEHSVATWIALTILSPGTKIIGDISYEILSRFDYTSKTINLSIGYVNDKMCYLRSGPCVTICNLKTDLTMKPHSMIEQLEIMPLWSIYNCYL